MALSIILFVEDVKQLPFSLSMLVKQTSSDFEVLVTHCHQDYKRSIELICASTAQKLKLRILDFAGSTKIEAWQSAANEAQYDWILSIDSATLLNPNAVSAYLGFSKRQAQGLIFGYVSESGPDAEVQADEIASPSIWFPQQQVKHLDFRYVEYSPKRIKPSPNLAHFPYWFAAGNNACIHKANLVDLGGLDPQFTSWRRAWVDLTYRALQKELPINFFLDSWAEYLISTNAQTQRPDTQKRYPQLSGKEASLVYRPQGLESLLKRVYSQSKQAEVISLSDSYSEIGHFDLSEKLSQRPPDFLVIGAQKAGTTSLYNYLQTHPRIVPARQKELQFFGDQGHYHKGFEWYLEQFNFAENKLSFEGTPYYLFRPEVPEQIAKHLPKIKLIMILRDPVARAYSDWNMYHRVDSKSHDERSFEQAVRDELAGKEIQPRYLERGLYFQQIQRYLNYFDASQLLILDFDELKASPQTTLSKCFSFLNIEPIEIQAESLIKANKGEYKQKMNPELEQELKQYFSKENLALKQNLDLPFEWLN